MDIRGGKADARKEKINQQWLFHYGEIGMPKKQQKSPCIRRIDRPTKGRERRAGSIRCRRRAFF